jgi:hypothetical protein
MNKKIITSLCFGFVFIIIFLFPFNLSFAKVNDSSGFISDRVWYSKEPLIDGETVNIYTAIWNGEESAISTTVTFYDKKTILGKRDIVLGARELKNVFIPWKVTTGDHLISAKITDSFSNLSNEKVKILLKNDSTIPDKQFVSVKISNTQTASAQGADAVKNEINKKASSVGNMIPENIKKFVIDIFHKIDRFRKEQHAKIDILKDEIKQELDNKNNQGENKNDLIILYVKFYLCLILSFILASQLLFYGLSILIIFYLFKLIFRRR